MAYRLAPLLGAYREVPLLGVSSWTAKVQTEVLKARMAQNGFMAPTQVIPGPAPVTPVSSPTMVSVPTPPPAMTITSGAAGLPMAPSVPPAPGSSPMVPTGGGGGAAEPQPVPTTPEQAHSTTPGWALPAAAALALFLFIKH